jgi:RNA recognition motif-containing protein
MTKLYVGNLSYGITNDNLLQLFNQRGYQPVSATVVTDRDSGQSRGFGFVELGSGDDAQKAIEEFNGFESGGRRLIVNEARQQESRGGGGGRNRFGGGGGRHGGGGGRQGY